MAISTLFVAIRNSSAELLINHAVRLTSQGILPSRCFISPLIMPCRIHYSSSFSFLIMCTKYWNLLIFIKLTNPASLFIRSNTSSLVIFWFHNILSFLLCNQSSRALSLLVIAAGNSMPPHPREGLRTHNTFGVSFQVSNSGFWIHDSWSWGL